MSALAHTSIAQPARAKGTFASQLIGVWALTSYVDEQPGVEDVHPFGPEPEGFLIYTADGFVSAQLMRPARPPFSSSDWHHGTPQEYQTSGSGYIAYCGIYEVDEEKATVTHIPSVSLLPNLIHARQCRAIDLQTNLLILRAAGTPVAGGVYVTSRLEWKRITPNSALRTVRLSTLTVPTSLEKSYASRPPYRLR